MTNERSSIRVDVVRSGRWWAIRVPVLPGVFSQCRRIEQIEAFATEAIALAQDIDPDEVGPLDVHVEPPGDVGELIAASLSATEAARSAAAVAAESRRHAARTLADEGYSTRDIGALLHISHQRVSQLLAEAG